ncbi:hypothetical protein ERJ75_000369700 [Trypanosoma vivax]|nr:hypothetical protein ERJ75_000369700 [Trypanosoma vivax]
MRVLFARCAHSAGGRGRHAGRGLRRDCARRTWSEPASARRSETRRGDTFLPESARLAHLRRAHRDLGHRGRRRKGGEDAAPLSGAHAGLARPHKYAARALQRCREASRHRDHERDSAAGDGQAAVRQQEHQAQENVLRRKRGVPRG